MVVVTRNRSSRILIPRRWIFVVVTVLVCKLSGLYLILFVGAHFSSSNARASDIREMPGVFASAFAQQRDTRETADEFCTFLTGCSLAKFILARTNIRHVSAKQIHSVWHGVRDVESGTRLFSLDCMEHLKHLHLGQSLAVALRSATGFSDGMTLVLLSMFPLVELRGGIPVGLWMGIPLSKVIVLCIFGNMLPVLPILFAFRLPVVRRFCGPLLQHADTKLRKMSTKDRWIGIAAFVGIPLPGTGAWTGATIAFLLGMKSFSAFLSILAGVCTAATIMVGLTLAGWCGRVFAVLLPVFLLSSGYVTRK